MNRTIFTQTLHAPDPRQASASCPRVAVSNRASLTSRPRSRGDGTARLALAARRRRRDGVPSRLMSSSESGEFVAGTPVKARPVLPAPPPKEGGRFARGPPLAQPAVVRSDQRVAPPTASDVSGPAYHQRVVAPAGRGAASSGPGPGPATQPAPLAGRFAAPSFAEPTTQWTGQGSLLLQRGAGGFSRIAQERQRAHAPQFVSEPSLPVATAAVGVGNARIAPEIPRAEAR